MAQRRAIIIGAGPAGLTAAYELLRRSDIVPVVLEASGDIGGISKTVAYKGNRIDIGGHRFFSKSDRVMTWWQDVLPLQGAPSRDDRVLGRTVSLSVAPDAPDPEVSDRVMLVRGRLSRIFFLRKFFDYPISLKWQTFRNLGPWRIVRIGFSYVFARLRPVRVERSLEDFFINRFGGELYRTFFRDYTEKVWGVPCTRIKPDWGAQRIKGLSVTTAVIHAFKSIFVRDRSVDQKSTETSLIEQFMYPKYGPGQMWETVADDVRRLGGEVRLHAQATGLRIEGDRVAAVRVRDADTGAEEWLAGDYVFSTMPVKELIAACEPPPPPNVREVAAGLVYRDFVTIGLLLRKLAIRNETRLPSVNDIVPDNWIYIQEREVKLGRLQIFNNWSPYMVADPATAWIGLEYFCNEGDDLWSMADDDFCEFAVEELDSIDIIDKADVLDRTIIRMRKTYPAYFGSYDRFQEIREYVDGLENLFLVGRNGMHKYNNADHSMLTAMVAVDHILAGDADKAGIWAVNTEEEYHEKK